MQLPDYRSWAIMAHGDQKYDGFTYAFHLAKVEAILNYYEFTEHNYKAAAWLHDVLEDTNMDATILNFVFGEAVTEMVQACTGVGKTRADRDQSIYDKITNNPKAAPVKVADRLANINYGITGGSNSTMVRKYISYHSGFKKALAPLMVGDERSVRLWQAYERAISCAKMLDERKFPA